MGVVDWQAAVAAVAGCQAGLELLSVLPWLARSTDFYALRLNPGLTLNIPAELEDPALQDRMARVLAPPPRASADEILAGSGGMFYPRDAPGTEPHAQPA